MKKLHFYLCFLMSFSLILGCQKMDDSYRRFIVEGGLTYPGKPRVPKVYSGHNRVKISWVKSTDPSVVRANVFWHNYQDSMEVKIPSTGDTITAIIGSLPEQQYTFEIVTYNKQGDKSEPAEVLGTSYGDIYKASLLDRPINQALVNDDGTLSIQWGAANITDGAYATELTYTNSSNNEVTERYSIEEEKSIVSDIKQGTSFDHRTVYLPDSTAIDTFYTAYETYGAFLFDKSTWKVIDFSTEHDNSAENRVGNIIDGNSGTRWHAWVNSTYPHYVVVDMQKPRSISAFEIFRMTDDDRACDRFELAISDDNVTWKVLGDFDFNRFTNAGQMYPFSSLQKARYFKFTGLSGPVNYMVTGEINVYGN